MPKAWAIALGLCLGGLAGFALLTSWPPPSFVGPSLFLGLAGLAAYTAWSGEPITVPIPEDTLWASIPGGSFSMGSNDYDNEKPIHTVHLSPFLMMKTPVTRKHYQQIIGKDPGWPEGEADEKPVNKVSWYDAVDFCNRWSVVDGLTPCYQIDGDTNVTWIDQADGYRLPTEAEWEYACRAGSTTRWCFGDDEAESPDYAWFYKNADGKPHSVATLKPNAWGLYDMHGNVWEWCWNWHGRYTELKQADPLGAAEGSDRLLRGGSFDDSPVFLRSAIRFRNWPEYLSSYVGFRCVRRTRRI